MRQMIFIFSAIFMLSVLFHACQQAPQNAEESWEAAWLGDSKQEVIDNIENQFQGFSRAMVETGYRYQELYWAGQDENWEYAEYQREHIEEALEDGFVRRPDREASSQQFMSVALPEMEQVIADGDQDAFLESYTRLTASCNTCHAMEEVAFMVVKIPENRTTVIHF